MSRYKPVGIFTRMREIRRWIVVVDGEEFPFVNKNHALLSAKAADSVGKNVKLIEETTLRFTSPARIYAHDEKFRIDITNQIHY